MGSLSILQGIFPTQGLNPGFPHCKWILYQLGHKGSPWLPWTLNAIMYVFIKRKQREMNYTERRKKCEDGAERGLKMLALKIGVMCHKPRTSVSHQKLEEARGRFSSTAFRSVPQLTTWFWPAAAAKSLQSCPTLCDPIDGSLGWAKWVWRT